MGNLWTMEIHERELITAGRLIYTKANPDQHIDHLTGERLANKHKQRIRLRIRIPYL